MKKRILSLALALLMVLALLPFGALAVGRPVTAPYKSTLKSILAQSNGYADGLFVDLNGDDVPELLVAYEYYDGVRGAAFYTIENHRAKWLLNADNLSGDLSFYSTDYSSVDVVSRSGAVYVMASRTSSREAEVDEQYGQTYWNSGEFWLYRFADAAVTQVDHWSYRLHELEDGRYFEGEGGVKHNGAPASVEALDEFWGSLTFACTVSLFEDTDGIPVELLLRATEGKFIDVEPEEYYARPVDWAVAKGITNGTGAFTFSPNNPCTRGQVVTFLWRAAGAPAPKRADNPFVDVNANDYFCQAVLWAVEQGITNGTSPTTFSPNNPCTRGQVVTFLHRNANQPQVKAENPFRDVASGAYYYDAVLWAVGQKITNGTSDTTFSPDQTCTRGQIVTFLYRAMADPNEPLTPARSELAMAASNARYPDFYGRDLVLPIGLYTNTTVTIASVGDSETNLKALLDGEVQLCVCRADDAYAAYQGIGKYADAGPNHDFSVLGMLYQTGILAVTTDRTMTSIADLRGKTVSLGPKDSALSGYAQAMLAAYELTPEDIHPVYMTLEETAAALKSGEIDAAFVEDGNDWADAMEPYALQYYITDLPLDQAHLDAVIEGAPYYTSWEHSQGTVRIASLLLVRNDVSDDDVYNIVSTITDQTIMDSSYWHIEEFIGTARGIPYHPVAAEWYGI